MYNKKCRPEQQWCECKKRPCKKERDVVYYPCKEKKSKKCDKCIHKTHELIEGIEYVNEQLDENLETALYNQEQAELDLSPIEAALRDIATTLGNLQTDLYNAQQAIYSVIDDLEEIETPYQENAIKAIKDAMDNQEEIENIVECLEDSFKGTVKCLKAAASGGCPILIPEPTSDCECKHDHEWDCEYEWEEEDEDEDCDCNW